MTIPTKATNNDPNSRTHRQESSVPRDHPANRSCRRSVIMMGPRTPVVTASTRRTSQPEADPPLIPAPLLGPDALTSRDTSSISHRGDSPHAFPGQSA